MDGEFNQIEGHKDGSGEHAFTLETIFAESDSCSSEYEPGSNVIFAEESESSDWESDKGNDEDGIYPFVNFSSEAACEPLPTLYAAKKVDDYVKVPRFKCECQSRCDKIAENLTDENFRKMKEHFTGQNMTETKNIILNHLNTQDEILKIKGDGFFYGGQAYCASTFSKIIGVSRYILRKVEEAHERGSIKFVHNNSQGSKNCHRKVNAMCWFKSFSQIYGQRAPDVQLAVLPSWLDKSTVFNIYKQENPIIGEQIKYSTFCKMLKKDFGPRRKEQDLPRIRFSKYSTHSVCNECYDLDKFQQTCRTEQDIKLCQALKFKHRERFSKQQRCITSIKHLSQTFPDQYFSIYIDSMDNMKSHIPRFLEKTKKLANFWKLPSKVTGCIIFSSHYPLNRKIKMFLNFDQYEQGNSFMSMN